MSLSIILKGVPKVPGFATQQVALITGDAAYPNPAGYVLTAATFNLTVLKKIVSVTPATAAALAFDYAVVPTYSTDGENITSAALHLAVSTTGVEVANGVSVITAAVTVIAEGN